METRKNIFGQIHSIKDFHHLDYVNVYVDGSFMNNQYSGAFVVFDPKDNVIFQDHGIGIQDPELMSMRNISGEMSAAMRAALWIDTYVGRGNIIHDYIGLAKWVTGEWQATKKYTKVYRDFMLPFYTLDIIKFQWVKGHTKIVGNEIADRLARDAIIYKKQWTFEA